VTLITIWAIIELCVHVYNSHNINYASILHKYDKMLNNNVFKWKNHYVLDLVNIDSF
jgi:hypothetical protein